jgi:2-polyprenyl-6-methoxyphenol hydroxylase-like FAD-dependent oxidoreductase
MKVLISGGGVAGNALAFWLSKLGHDITIIERFPTLRATGLQVDLRGHGIEVMRRMGLEPAFRSKSVQEQGIQIVDSSGKRRAYFPANKSGKGPQSFTSEFEIMRGDLCRLLYDVSKDRAKYVFGTSIESFKQNDNSVEVRFSDGKTGKFDLLVGADGQGSRTRKMMLGTDTPDGFYPFQGIYSAYFTIPRPMQKGEEYIATLFMAPGRRGVMTRRSNPHEIQVYLGGKSDSERLKNARQGNIKEEKEALAEIFHGVGWQTNEILESLKDTENFYCERLGLVKLNSWSHGLVTLVGDAAYCPSPKSGMGTTSAIVGAYILAGEIGRHCGQPGKEDADGGNAAGNLRRALEAYEEKFRPFMTHVQKGISADSSWDLLQSSAFGIAAINCFLGVVSFLKLNIANLMVEEEIKGWDLPEYKEMQRN